jgi:murein DD-endopeptidase MepM/ murein hydrolase activator NlpD
MRLASSKSPNQTPDWRPARGRWLIGVFTMVLGLSCAPGPSQANLPTTWGRGSFPVASFVGYSSPFGLRVHPVHGGLRPHEGLDIAAPLGSEVRNWWSGTVVDIFQDSGCGNGLVIRSGRYEHLYCHLAGRVEGNTYRSGSIWLRRGQRLRTGQTLATSASVATPQALTCTGACATETGGWIQPRSCGRWPPIVARGSQFGAGLLMLESPRDIAQGKSRPIHPACPL